MSDLDQRIAALEVLDNARTQGKWFCTIHPETQFGPYLGSQVIHAAANEDFIPAIAMLPDDGANKNGEFIAAAPEMMLVIRELKAERDALLRQRDPLDEALNSGDGVYRP